MGKLIYILVYSYCKIRDFFLKRKQSHREVNPVLIARIKECKKSRAGELQKLAERNKILKKRMKNSKRVRYEN